MSVGAGLSYGEMGSTHHSIEEAAIMKSLPNLTVEFPSDGAELRDTLKYALSQEKPFYISFPKAPDTKLMPHSYEYGKGVKYMDGKDGAIIAVGYSVSNAIKAAESLKEKGIDIAVYGIHSVKPLDKNVIFEAASKKNIFVVDEHQSVGGAASDIAKILLQNKLFPENFVDLSVPDTFVERVSKYNELLDLYSLSAEKITQTIETTLSCK